MNSEKIALKRETIRWKCGAISSICEQTVAVTLASFWRIPVGQLIASITRPWLVACLPTILVKRVGRGRSRRSCVPSRTTGSARVLFTAIVTRQETNLGLVTGSISWPMTCTKSEQDSPQPFVFKLKIIAHFRFFVSHFCVIFPEFIHEM